MKRILQSLILMLSVLILFNACSTYPYSDEDQAMGFGPVGDTYLEKQGKFKTDKRHNIHDDKDE